MADDAARAHVVTEIARHQARLRGFLRCLLVRPSDIDDLLQEINTVLWQKAGDFVPGTDFWAWASQVARYQAFNQISRYGRERLVFDDALLGAACRGRLREAPRPRPPRAAPGGRRDLLETWFGSQANRWIRVPEEAQDVRDLGRTQNPAAGDTFKKHDTDGDGR